MIDLKSKGEGWHPIALLLLDNTHIQSEYNEQTNVYLIGETNFD